MSALATRLRFLSNSLLDNTGHLAEAPMTTAVSFVIASPLNRAEGFSTRLVQSSKGRKK